MNKPKMNLMLATALTLALASLAGLAQAQEATPEAAPVPDNAVTYNAALVSDYRYRGISQSRLKPALQGGADYTHNPTGLYAGTWLSTIKWIKDAGGDDNLEWDVYAGKRGELAKDFTYDVGGLYYYYPDNGLATNANTFELYGQLAYGPAYIKYSHSTSNLFGVPDSKRSGYIDLGANVDMYQGYMLNLHVGHQKVKAHSELSYTDYKVGVTKDFGVVSVSLAAVHANTSAYVGPADDFKNLGKTGAVLTISKTF